MKILNRQPFKAGDRVRVVDGYSTALENGSIHTVDYCEVSYNAKYPWFVVVDGIYWVADRFERVTDEDTE